MKKNVLYIASEKFAAIATEAGVPTKDNAGFTQWILGNGYHLYVAKTKTVGRVDFQFLPPVDLKGVRVLGEGERFGRILAQLDFDTTLGEAAILEAFTAMTRHGASLAEWERPKKVMAPKPIASSPEASTPDSSPVDEEAEKILARAKRAEMIAKVAKEKGVDISPNANL